MLTRLPATSPQDQLNTSPLYNVLAQPNPGIYSVAAAPVGYVRPTMPGGPPQMAADACRQSYATFDRGDLSLAGPWRSFFAGAVRSDVIEPG